MKTRLNIKQLMDSQVTTRAMAMKTPLKMNLFYQTYRFHLSSKKFVNAGKFSWSWILQCCNFIQKDKENLSLCVCVLQKHHIALQSQALDLKELYQKG